MKVKAFFKWLLPALLLSGGVAAAAEMENTVESFLPVINTITPEKTEYCLTVTGNGYIYNGGTDDKWFARVQINESDIKNVKTGQSARLSGAAIEEGVYSACVTSVSDTAKQVASRGFMETVVDVTLEITNPDADLRSGYTVSADIAAGEMRDIYILPYEVICQDDVGEYVYILRSNTAVRRDIVTGAEFARGTELLSGLRETDEVITEPGIIENNKNGALSLLVKKEGSGGDA